MLFISILAVLLFYLSYVVAKSGNDNGFYIFALIVFGMIFWIGKIEITSKIHVYEKGFLLPNFHDPNFYIHPMKYIIKYHTIRKLKNMKTHVYIETEDEEFTIDKEKIKEFQRFKKVLKERYLASKQPKDNDAD